MSDKNVLVIFAKHPELGKVKTRLAKDIGNNKAMEIYKSLVMTAITNHSQQNYDLLISSPNLTKKMEEWTGIKTILQTGENLGERIHNTFKELLKQYKKVIIIGADIPELESHHAEQAFEGLDNHDIVFIPSTDGGYTLIAMKKPHDVFSGIEWSTPTNLKDTLKKIEPMNLKVKLLEELSDIDTIDDYDKYCLSREMCE